MQLLTILLDQVSEEPELQRLELMMILGACITQLEAYLSDVFLRQVDNDRAFEERHLRLVLGDQKVSTIFKYHQSIKARIRENILNHTLFHNMDKVIGLYQSVLGVDCKHLSNLKPYVDKRHGIIHRGGYDTSKEPIHIDIKEVKQCIQMVQESCQIVDEAIFPPVLF